MRSAPSNLYDEISSFDNILSAVYEAARWKKKDEGTDVAKVLDAPKFYASNVYSFLSDKSYKFAKCRPFTINENSPTKKKRIIKKPKFIHDQIVHHSMIRVMKHEILGRLYTHSYGSLPDRGIHAAKRIIEKYIKEAINHNLPVFAFQGDFYHYYPSIDKDILVDKTARIFGRDRDLMSLIMESIFIHDEHGIPLGYYTSVWYAMIYALAFDYFICSIKGTDTMYIRFMDDIIVLSHDKDILHRIYEESAEYLETRMKLKYKENHRIFRLHDIESNAPYLDVLGFKFSMGKTKLRNTNYDSLKQSCRIIMDSPNPTDTEISGFLSRIGLLSHTGSSWLMDSILSSVDMDYVLCRMQDIVERNRSYRKVCAFSKTVSNMDWTE